MVEGARNVEDLLEKARAHNHRLVLSKHVEGTVYGEGTVARFNKAVAVKITVAFGSIWALYVLIAWMLGWIAWQESGAGLIIKDPYPFGFVLFLSNLIQLWALPAILVGQNVLAAQTDVRATADHETLEMLHTVNTTELEILLELQRMAQRRGFSGTEVPPPAADSAS
jgi:uncharacterized membrane protein